MTVGFYSPLPPCRSGVADYSGALLPELRRHGRVEVAPRECDIALYHIGNNALHASVYRRALHQPGIVVLHDAVLHHFLLGFLDEAAYVEEFVYDYGEWNRGLAHELWRGRASSGADAIYFEFPMLRRIAERALAVVTHNPEAARIVRKHAPAARVVEIPHFYSPPSPEPAEWEPDAWRRRLGVEPGSFLFGIFGYLRESKRLLPVLEAFARVHAEIPRTSLLVAGDFVSSDLERAAGSLLNAPGVFRRPFLEDHEFWVAASALDACINLRYPAAGETSGISIRMMGIGKPVLVTDSPENARFPEDACIRIPPGAAERDSLLEHMRLLPSMAGVAQAIGQRAALDIRRSHRFEEAGRLYWELLCEYCA